MQHHKTTRTNKRLIVRTSSYHVNHPLSLHWKAMSIWSSSSELLVSSSRLLADDGYAAWNTKKGSRLKRRELYSPQWKTIMVQSLVLTAFKSDLRLPWSFVSYNQIRCLLPLWFRQLSAKLKEAFSRITCSFPCDSNRTGTPMWLRSPCCHFSFSPRIPPDLPLLRFFS